MFYLTAQIWLHLGLAFALGGGVVWWYLRRTAEEGLDEVPAQAEPKTLALVERLTADAATTEETLAAARSDLQHAREELLLKTDELAHRRAEWIEESASQRRDIESLRSQLHRRRTPPRAGRLEPRLPEQLLLHEEDKGDEEPTRDDLTRIKGVGRVLAGLLNEMGIYTFSEIASWTSSDIERIQSSLPQFPGRIRRDDWVAQAAELDQTSRV